MMAATLLFLIVPMATVAVATGMRISVTTQPTSLEQSTLPQPTTSVRTCSVDADGTLTMFNRETAIVAVPCKYRLADFTCGDYSVKVTPGSAVADNGRFSPSSVWVKVVDMTTNDILKLRTSLKVLRKYEDGDSHVIWKKKEGNIEMIDFHGYDKDTRMAFLEKSGVFLVEFGHNGVIVSCSVDKFSSTGLPDTLCGDQQTANELGKVKKEIFGGSTTLSDNEFLKYVIMMDETVSQSKTCSNLASRFRACEEQHNVIYHCDSLFGNEDLVLCLAEKNITPSQAYAMCLTAECEYDLSAKNPLNDCMN